MRVEELIEEALDLPVEERILIADSLLRSLNAPDPEVEAVWMEEVARRREEVLSGRATLIPGEEVFAKIWQRFSE